MTATIMRDPQFYGEGRQVSQTTYRRTFKVGPYDTLAGVNLEPGDTLPEDSTVEITESWIDTVKNERVARVIAVAYTAES